MGIHKKTELTDSEINISRDKLQLHENILDILFKHKEEIYTKLNDLKGIFLIDHIAIKIIDPNNKILIFSIAPSVEYNLIVNELWKFDGSFSTSFRNNKIFSTWDEAYSTEHYYAIKEIKELNHGFTLGFSLSKKISCFQFIYSFATRSKNNGLVEYYQSHMNELVGLGDYGYKLIHGIYANYCDENFDPPMIIDGQNNYKKPLLRLITNNM